VSDSNDDGSTNRVIPGYGSAPIPSLESIGGEVAVLAATTDSDGIDLFTAAAATCISWPQVDDRDAVKAWLRDAIAGLRDEELLAFNDIVLASPDALPDLAAVLTEAWRAVSDVDIALRGSVAIEGWTRLAVGGWTAAIPLRGALYGRAQRSATGVGEPDIFLVRSLGAALDQWGDEELEGALELLASFDDLECDVAFELGMSALRKAVCASAPSDAIVELNHAQARFNGACVEGDRPDAAAFATACAAVAGFLGGDAVAEQSVLSIEAAAREWFMGYLGEIPHWRQPRAETAGAWALLIRDLYQLRDLDSPAWFEPAKLLADVGHVYCAYNSSTLLANPRKMPGRSGSGGEIASEDPLPVALGPRLESALGADAQKMYLVERWLTAFGERLEGTGRPEENEDTAAAAALQAALARIREGPTSQGKLSASREDDGLDPDLREALTSVVGQDACDQIAASARRFSFPSLLDVNSFLPGALRYAPLDEQLLLERLLRRHRDLRPTEFAIWQQHLSLLLTLLIRIVKDTIDHEQGGSRRYAWHQIEPGKTAAESTLADHLAMVIKASTGLPTDVELSNRAGGRADVVITFDAERFVIEVKRISKPATDAELSEDFGDQAGQYTLTGPPFAFLAVLDLSRWDSRLPVSASFWIDPWKIPTADEIRALTGFRVLADVATPSDLSR
jgi:hypothetical protein